MPLLLAARWHFGADDQNTKGPNNFVPQIWHAKFRPWPLRLELDAHPVKGWKGFATPLHDHHTITLQQGECPPPPRLTLMSLSVEDL